ncbi:response regulator [Erwinia sp. E602]|uniref:response regulator transcription factor n=1 Tax=unclassified Erwinia TaxID=2622719 RepID=UPI0006F1CDD8|nr:MULTISPECIES: response regulator transcription factor [unclassified Erwinia]KQN63264.1 two-component system response regulator [Erwinia sp. Leaf53]PLV54735.1 fimbrial protein [Erwinia sp. B116]QUG77705.1 response regulator [Erwinia sp. E602]
MYSRYTVTVSDDHPHIMHSLKMLFSTSDRFLITNEAACGKDLLSVLAVKTTDIVITDFSLGSDRSTIDGFTKLRALAARYPDTHIVLLTSQKNVAILRKACDYGIRAIVSKSDAVEETVLACHHVVSQQDCYFSSSLSHLKAPLAKGNERGNTLTPKELEVVRLFSSGYSLAEIAHRQNRTISTISTQKYNAMRRLGVSTNIELIRYAYAQGLI